MDKKFQNAKTYNFLENPMTQSARQSMTPEQIEEYKKIGEYMHNNVDFETNKVLQDEPLVEGAASIVEAIKSGLCYEMLEEDEKKVMKEVYGSDWKKKFY